MNPITLAQICADVYQSTPVGFDHEWDFAGTHAAHRRLEGVDVIVFRGSLDAVDWLRDLEALPIWDPRLGFVHSGFMAGMNDILVAASLVLGPRVVITGHSLGGARARILAGLLAYTGVVVDQCTVFGSPRPAFANLRRLLEKSGVTLSSYRNRNDPVPLVPFMGGLFEHTDQWTALDAPAPPDDLEPLRDHHMIRYIEGLTKMAESGSGKPAERPSASPEPARGAVFGGGVVR